MILFIFEGKKREPALFSTLEYLYFPKENQKIIYSYENNIYSLYKELKNNDFTQDIVSVLRAKTRNLSNDPFKEITKTSDISEIYLFFDYDCQNQDKLKTMSLDELNKQLEELLVFFSSETENGKLYINYPMIESIRYTKELPDSNYNSYKIEIDKCGDFKQIANNFSFYKNLDFIILKETKLTNLEKIKVNWNYLTQQNVEKAFYLVNKDITSEKKIIEQKDIFSAQLENFINKDNTVSILNDFPIFLYDYF